MNAKYTERIQSLINELNSGICERESVTKLALLCAIAGVRANISGPRGTAKSLIAERIASVFPSTRQPDISVSNEPDPDPSVVMRLRTAPIASEAKFLEMAFSYDLPKSVKTPLSEPEIDAIRTEAKKVQVPLSLKNTYVALRRFFTIYASGGEEEMQFDVNDALWPRITAVVKTAAVLNDRSSVDSADITLIANCFWTKPAQIPVLKPFLDFIFNNLTTSGRETINHLSCEIDNFSSLVTETFFHYRPAQYDFEFINGRKFWKVRASEDGTIVYISEERSQRNDGLVAHEMYFNGELGETEGYFENGDFVSVTQNARYPIIRMQGTGYATPKSEIYCNAFSTVVNDFTKEKFIPLSTQLESAIDSMTAIVAQSQERYKKDLFASSEAADRVTFSQIESLAGLRELRTRLQNEYIRYAKPLLLAAPPAGSEPAPAAQTANAPNTAAPAASAVSKPAQAKEQIVIAKAIPLEEPPSAPESEPPVQEPPVQAPPAPEPPIQPPPQIETPPAVETAGTEQPPVAAAANAEASAAAPEQTASASPALNDAQAPADNASAENTSEPKASGQTAPAQTPSPDGETKQPPAANANKTVQPGAAPKAPLQAKKKVILGPNGKPLILPKKFKFVIPKKPLAK